EGRRPLPRRLHRRHRALPAHGGRRVRDRAPRAGRYARPPRRPGRRGEPGALHGGRCRRAGLRRGPRRRRAAYAPGVWRLRRGPARDRLLRPPGRLDGPAAPMPAGGGRSPAAAPRPGDRGLRSGLLRARAGRARLRPRAARSPGRARARPDARRGILDDCGPRFAALGLAPEPGVAAQLDDVLDRVVDRARHFAESVYPPHTLGPTAEPGPFPVGVQTLALVDPSRTDVTGSGPQGAMNRPLDLRFVTDRMLAFDAAPGNFFADLIDAARIAATGHSFGGFTDFLIAGGASPLGTFTDPRVRAIFPMAPAAVFA